MELGNIMLNEISQTQKFKICVLFHALKRKKEKVRRVDLLQIGAVH